MLPLFPVRAAHVPALWWLSIAHSCLRLFIYTAAGLGQEFPGGYCVVCIMFLFFQTHAEVYSPLCWFWKVSLLRGGRAMRLYPSEWGSCPSRGGCRHACPVLLICHVRTQSWCRCPLSLQPCEHKRSLYKVNSTCPSQTRSATPSSHTCRLWGMTFSYLWIAWAKEGTLL